MLILLEDAALEGWSMCIHLIVVQLSFVSVLFFHLGHVEDAVFNYIRDEMLHSDPHLRPIASEVMSQQFMRYYCYGTLQHYAHNVLHKHTETYLLNSVTF